MSEWEEFAAYRGIIQDAKNEARKEIIHDRKAIAEYAMEKQRKWFVNILMGEHSHDPGLCGDVADYTNNGVYSDECLYLQRIYARMSKE